MDAATLAFLAIVIVASGAIAYFADWLGRKLGKKRLSIGKMRPRHTAAFLTTMSGMVVSLLTIVIVMAFSSDVRDWILKGNSAIREAQQRLAELNDIKKELASKEGLLAARTGELQKLQVQLDKQKRDALAQIQKLQDQAKTLASDVQDLRKERDQAKAQLAISKGDVVRAKSSLARVTGTLTTSRTELKKAQQQVKTVVDQYNEVSERTGQLERELQTAEQKLEDANKEIANRRSQIENLNTSISNLNTTLANTQTKLSTTSQELEEEQEKLELKKIELDGVQGQLQRAIEGLQGNLLNTRWKRIIVPGGAEMARLQIQPGQSAEQVWAQLEVVLRNSRQAAADRGAKPPRAGLPAASIKNQMVNGKVVTAQEQADAVIKAATNLSEESVIIASSFWNVFEDEDVPLLVVAYRNPLIYRQGQIVAETRIDGRMEDGVILKQLSDFLSDKVKRKAMADKMIPVGGSDPTFGQVTFEELFSLTRDIKEQRRQVRLVALAKQDTRAADALRLDLKLR